MAKYIIKAFLIIVISITLITGILTKYVGLPVIDIQKVNAAFSSTRSMMGAAGIVVFDPDDVTSYKFDASANYLSVPDHANWSFGNSDFEIDLWANFDNVSSDKSFVAQQDVAATFTDLSFRFEWQQSTTTLRFAYSTNGTSWNFPGVSWSPSADTWYHIAVTRNGADLRFFIGGIQAGSNQNVSTDTFYSSTELLRIGTYPSGGSWIDVFQGNIDEFRISDIARWASNFTPETSAYTSDANTVLLIHCGETKTGTTGSGATFTDSGNTGHTVTEIGNAIEDTVVYKF